MSHTPMLAWCLGSRPLSPLGGGNVAALQHEGRVGSVRPARSFRGEETCSRAPPGSHHPSRRASAVGGREGSARVRPPAGRSAFAPDARRPPGDDTGSPDRTSRGGGGRGPGHEERGLAEARRQPSGDSRAPGGRPRDQGGDADRARHDPGEGSGVSARRKSVPGRLGSGLRGSTLAASSQGRPGEGRIPGTAAAAPGGRGGGGGRLAPRPGERPGGPGLSPPPPQPLGAGGTRSGCARRGRKLSDLASAGRHSDSD